MVALADPFGMTAVFDRRHVRLGVLLAALGAVLVVAVIRATGSSTSRMQAQANRAMAGVQVYTTTPGGARISGKAGCSARLPGEQRLPSPCARP